MKKIQLSHMRFALVDDEDYDMLREFQWSYTKGGYVLRSPDKYEDSLMHRFIMRYHGHNIDGLVIDHIDGYRLDNRKSNLRVVTKKINGRNMYAGNRSATGFRGVRHRNNLYYAIIMVNQKAHRIGAWETAREAALAYD
jgi:hypothetical protein